MLAVAIVMMAAMFFLMHGGDGMTGHNHDGKNASQEHAEQRDQKQGHKHGPATVGSEEERSEKTSDPEGTDAPRGEQKQ